MANIAHLFGGVLQKAYISADMHCGGKSQLLFYTVNAEKIWSLILQVSILFMSIELKALNTRIQVNPL